MAARTTGAGASAVAFLLHTVSLKDDSAHSYTAAWSDFFIASHPISGGELGAGDVTLLSVMPHMHACIR